MSFTYKIGDPVDVVPLFHGVDANKVPVLVMDGFVGVVIGRFRNSKNEPLYNVKCPRGYRWQREQRELSLHAEIVEPVAIWRRQFSALAAHSHS